MPTEPIAMGGLLLFGLAILGAGVFVATTGLDRIRTARTLREAGAVPLADLSAADDLVEFTGTAREATESLEAPLSGEACLAYTVYSRVRDDPSADDWRSDGRTSAGVPFAVTDGTNRVTVDPTNAVFSLEEWTADESSWTDRGALSAAVRERLAATGLPGVDDGNEGAATAERQYRERRLDPGAEVRVFGGSVVDSSGTDRADGEDTSLTVGGGDWFEISSGENSAVRSDHRRSGSLYVIFGALVSIPGIGFTLAGIAGLASLLVL